MRRLTPIQVRDLIERLAEHALDTGLEPKEVSRAFEKRFLEILLDLEGNQCAAARYMRIHRNTLNRHIKELGVEWDGRRREFRRKAQRAA